MMNDHEPLLFPSFFSAWSQTNGVILFLSRDTRNNFVDANISYRVLFSKIYKFSTSKIKNNKIEKALPCLEMYQRWLVLHPADGSYLGVWKLGRSLLAAGLRSSCCFFTLTYWSNFVQWESDLGNILYDYFHKKYYTRTMAYNSQLLAVTFQGESIQESNTIMSSISLMHFFWVFCLEACNFAFIKRNIPAAYFNVNGSYLNIQVGFIS